MPDTTISGYTTTYNCIEKAYPFRECIRSLLGFCDEVVVVDAGSTDGTIDEVRALQNDDRRIKFFVEPVDFSHPRWALYQDGYLKAKARARCTSSYCWQTDTDEIVPPDDFRKIKALPHIMGTMQLIMLPMVEFWGSFDTIRADFFSWKPRFSVNDRRIIHGIPHDLRLYDERGHEYPRPFDSDSCNYIYSDTLQGVPIIIPVADQMNKMGKVPLDEYKRVYHEWLEHFPCVLHTSWLDLGRKISHYRDFWPKFHKSMYNLDVADTPANNVMFDKPWSQVSDEDIEVKAKELREIGPRSFHRKINPAHKGATIKYDGAIPELLQRWYSKNTWIPASRRAEHEQAQRAQERELFQITEYPLISAVIPSYNKGKYLRESVESILGQEYRYTEIIIVNDGSTDDTAAVAETIIKAHPLHSIRLINQENRGVSAARNAGLQSARGEYVLTMDGDDLAAPSLLTRAVERLGKNGVNLFCTDVECFGTRPGEWIPNEYSPTRIRYDNSIPILAVYHRSLFERSGGYRVALGFAEDWEYWVNCSRYGMVVSRLREKLFRYRTHESGIAGSFINHRHEECQAVVMMCNEDLYAVDEVLLSHVRLGEMPESALKRVYHLHQIHPNEWVSKLWLGLVLERREKKEEALGMYHEAWKLSGERSWQAVFRIGVLLGQMKYKKECMGSFSEVRRLRPDAWRHCPPKPPA